MIKSKKSILITTVVCAALTFLSCADAVVNDGTKVRSYASASKKALYVAAEGYDMAPWNCWECTSTTALISELKEGGIRVSPIRESMCNYSTQTYFGINMAPGSGSGAEADLKGNGFEKVRLMVRGTIPLDQFGFYAISEKGPTGANAHAQGDSTVMDQCDKFVVDGTYSESEWATLEITGFESTQTMKSALTISVLDGVSADGYIDIKAIDWLDASGNSVVPSYK